MVRRTSALSLTVAVLLLVGGGRPVYAAGGGDAPAPPGPSSRVGLREGLRRALGEFQLYRGERLERFLDRLRVGRSDFDARVSVAENLRRLVAEQGLEHFYRDDGHGPVLHVVVPLAKGAATREILRRIYRRVGGETIELNLKTPRGRNKDGHLAVRVGDGATYDLLGTRPDEARSPLVKLALRLFTGRGELLYGRRRNLRRVMERFRPSDSPNVFYGLLFAASPEERAEAKVTYEGRRRGMTGFEYYGGDAKTIFNCAQFASEAPFFQARGIGNNRCRFVTKAAAASPELQAVLVYRTPQIEELPPLVWE